MLDIFLFRIAEFPLISVYQQNEVRRIFVDHDRITPRLTTPQDTYHLTRSRPSFGIRHIHHPSPFYAVVNISWPSSVIATVCSKWAHREPSCVTTVQLSASVRT